MASQEYKNVKASLINAGLMALVKDLKDTKDSIEFHEALLALETGQKTAVQDETAQDDNNVGNDGVQDDNNVGNDGDDSPLNNIDDITGDNVVIDETLADKVDAIRDYIIEGEEFTEEKPKMSEYTDEDEFFADFGAWKQRKAAFELDAVQGIKSRFIRIAGPIVAEIKAKMGEDLQGLYFNFEQNTFVFSSKVEVKRIPATTDKRTGPRPKKYNFNGVEWSGNGQLSNAAIAAIQKDSTFKSWTPEKIRDGYGDEHLKKGVSQSLHDKIIAIVESYKIPE